MKVKKRFGQRNQNVKHLPSVHINRFKLDADMYIVRRGPISTQAHTQNLNSIPCALNVHEKAISTSVCKQRYADRLHMYGRSSTRGMLVRN